MLHLMLIAADVHGLLAENAQTLIENKDDLSSFPRYCDNFHTKVNDEINHLMICLNKVHSVKYFLSRFVIQFTKLPYSNRPI